MKAGQHSGELRAGALGDLTLTAWSLVHGLALLIVGERIPGVKVDAEFVRHAARRCTALLIDGLRASGEVKLVRRRVREWLPRFLTGTLPPTVDGIYGPWARLRYSEARHS